MKWYRRFRFFCSPLSWGFLEISCGRFPFFLHGCDFLDSLLTFFYTSCFGGDLFRAGPSSSARALAEAFFAGLGLMRTRSPVKMRCLVFVPSSFSCDGSNIVPPFPSPFASVPLPRRPLVFHESFPFAEPLDLPAFAYSANNRQRFRPFAVYRSLSKSNFLLPSRWVPRPPVFLRTISMSAKPAHPRRFPTVSLSPSGFPLPLGIACPTAFPWGKPVGLPQERL